MLITPASMGVMAAPETVDCARAGPAFMAAYAGELTGGDRGATARRYSSRGAYSLGLEAKSFDSAAAIARRYAGPEWRKPDAFSRETLSFEQLNPATCLVVGSFRWTAAGRAMSFAYTAVLRATRWAA